MSTVTRYTDSYVSYAGDGYDGVGLVTTANSLGTGTLLSNGRAVLTAAHVVEDSIGAIRVAFDSAEGRLWATVEDYWVHPGYSTENYRDDLALLWLGGTVPLSIPRYELYRDSGELGRVATLVGYGATGLGIQGHVGSAGQQRSIVQNRLETTWDSVSAKLGGGSWYTPPGSQLVADFDSGNSRYDTLGNLLGLRNTGLGDVEGLIAPGDSGGPAFVDGKLAGVASYSASLRGSDGQRLDSTYRIDSSFGELGAWQRVSHYQDWIDDRLAEMGSSLMPVIEDLVRVGGGGRELLIGNLGNDELRAEGSNDRLFGGAGDDRLDGGSGVDVVRIEARLDAVSLAQGSDDTLIVVSEGTGHDTLVDIEVLRFEDRVILARAPELSRPLEMAFDQRLYLDANPDVATAVAQGDVGALDHYMRYGAHEGRDPNAFFDERGYREANPDVDAAIQRGELDSGYQHYQAWGWREGRDPSAWFDLGIYMVNHPDIAEAGVEPLGHYLRYGYNEGRIVVPDDYGLWG